MRLLALLLLALSLAAPAVAQDNVTDAGNDTEPDVNRTPTEGNETDEGLAEEPAGPIEIVLEGHQEGSAVFFVQPGAPNARNPTLTVQPGQQVTFIFRVVSGVHNLHIADGPQTAIFGEGEEEIVQWTAPTEPGRVLYWCDPHKAAGMQGTIIVGEAPTPGEGADAGQITGPTIDLGQYDPACEGQVAPAVVTQGIVGSPTLQDYIDACRGGDVDVAVDTSHPADWIIPISWVLIGLGVLGVVWVHKYYKP